MKKNLSALLILFLCNPLALIAQENIPIGTWRSHFSFADIRQLSVGPGIVVGMNEQGLLVFDPEDNSLRPFTRFRGLSDYGLSQVAFDPPSALLLITYQNGNIDVLEWEREKVHNIPTIAQANVPFSKNINGIFIQSPRAYLASDFGLSIVNLDSKALEQSYTNLGENGAELAFQDVTILGDTLFLSANNEFIRAPIDGSANLFDFNPWQRVSLPETNIIQMAASEEELFFIGENGGLYSYQEGDLQLLLMESDLGATREFRIFDGLLYAMVDQEVLLIDPQSLLMERFAFDHPVNDLLLVDGEAFLGSQGQGILKGRLTLEESFFEPLTLRGPFSNQIASIFPYEGGIIASQSNATQALENPELLEGQFSVFDGSWHTFRSGSQLPGGSSFPVFRSIGAAFYKGSGNWLLGSWADGLLFTEDGEALDASNSNLGLSNLLEGQTSISYIQKRSQGGYWIANHSSAQPLQVLDREGNLSNQSGLNLNQGTVVQILEGRNHQLWLRLFPRQAGAGLVGLDTQEGRSVVVNTGSLSGNLPSNQVNAIALDQNFQLWIGTDRGIFFLPNPGIVFSGNAFEVATPFFEDNPLLRDQLINDIQVDAGNRLWIATNNGAWLFANNGTRLVHHFTRQNSPLPANQVQKIAINPINGEVFFLSNGTLSSYRSGASKGIGVQEKAKIFPNPVQPGFNGRVGIEGLANNAIVKITDVSGRLVRETLSYGGTASWDLADYNGRRVASGIYLVFSSNREGEETLVGKIAVVK